VLNHYSCSKDPGADVGPSGQLALEGQLRSPRGSSWPHRTLSRCPWAPAPWLNQAILNFIKRFVITWLGAF
jgi:hypothetical protein